MYEILAIANQKGGVGKTTTAINLSSSLVYYGKKVLLIDMDPQGNCSRGLGIDPTVIKRTLFDVLAKNYDINKAIRKSSMKNLDIIASNLMLASVEAALAKGHLEATVYLLKNVLSGLEDIYDYIVLDCPPSLGLLSLNALTAATSVLIPVQCEYFAMEAVAQILSTISNVQRNHNPTLEIQGFLLTMYDQRTRLATEITTEVRGTFKEKTFITQIPRNVSLAECCAQGRPVTLYKPNAIGSTAYLALAREILENARQKIKR